MAKITKRILYSPSQKSVVGYVVEENGVEKEYEIMDLIRKVSTDTVILENAKIAETRYDGIYTLKGVKCALTKLPVVYNDKLVGI
jgi:hypothetical protein